MQTSIKDYTMNDIFLKNCTVVKCYLLILVMLYHSIVFWTGRWMEGTQPVIASEVLKYIAFWLNSFHIYAFTLVSGYIFAFKMRNNAYNNFKSLLKSKAKRLLIPYMFVMFFWVAPISAYLFNWDSGHLIKKFILCVNPSQLWFLWMLFGVFIIAWSLWTPLSKKPVIGWTISLICYLIGIAGNKLGILNLFCIWTAFMYVPFFYIGIRIRLKEENVEYTIIEAVPWYIWLIADIFVFTCTVLIGYMNGTGWRILFHCLFFLLHVIGAIMAWTVLQMIATSCNWQNNHIFKTLSRYSMCMFLFHQQFIYFAILWLDGMVNPLLHGVFNFIVAYIGSLLISAFLMQWEVTRILVGEKRSLHYSRGTLLETVKKN